MGTHLQMKQNQSISIHLVAVFAAIFFVGTSYGQRGKVGKGATKESATKEGGKPNIVKDASGAKGAGTSGRADIARPAGGAAGAAGASAIPKSGGGKSLVGGDGDSAGSHGIDKSANKGSDDHSSALKKVAPPTGRAMAPTKGLDKDKVALGEKIAAMDLLDIMKAPKDDERNVASTFGNKSNFSSKEGLVKDNLELFDKILPSKATDEQKQALHTAMGEALSRVNRLPEEKQGAALKELKEFAEKLKAAMDSKKTPEEQKKLLEFSIAALAFYGPHPKKGQSGADVEAAKDNMGFSKAIAKLDLYVKDEAAFGGLADYLTAAAKAIHTDLNAQLKGNPNAGRADLDYDAAHKKGVEAMQAWAQVRLRDNGVPLKDINHTVENLCTCVDQCKSKKS